MLDPAAIDFEQAHADSDTNEILHLDAIARFDMAVDDGLGSDAGDVDLAVGVVDVGEVGIPRHLTVNTDGLYPFENRVAGTLQHLAYIIIATSAVFAFTRLAARNR